MADDIVTRLREHHDSFRMAVGVNDAFILETIYGEAADEIERLRILNTELVKTFKQVGIIAEMWQKTEDELIELHHAKCAEQFAEQHKEIERLQAEIETLQGGD